MNLRRTRSKLPQLLRDILAVCVYCGIDKQPFKFRNCAQQSGGVQSLYSPWKLTIADRFGSTQHDFFFVPTGSTCHKIRPLCCMPAVIRGLTLWRDRGIYCLDNLAKAVGERLLPNVPANLPLRLWDAGDLSNQRHTRPPWKLCRVGNSVQRLCRIGRNPHCAFSGQLKAHVDIDATNQVFVFCSPQNFFFSGPGSWLRLRLRHWPRLWLWCRRNLGNRPRWLIVFGRSLFAPRQHDRQ